MVKVLIADDDKAILDLLHIYMKNEGYECFLANDGDEALELMNKNKDIDVALLDIMMPKMSGMEVLESMRLSGDQTPVIFITAKEANSDKITGLLAGADDYVTKPFEPLEVIARVKSILRRQGITAHSKQVILEQDRIDLGLIQIDKKAHNVTTIHGQEVKLTNLEFDILYLLAGERGKVFSAEDILHAVWSDPSTVSSKTVMVHVSNLRNKLEEATNGEKVIQTVWGVGYKIHE